ncbi:L-rhamnose mutarotase [Pedobacter arcticus]|uniref:L-rhamnose mutarotase n=1 Tax=Pedobacter arcticus TaxID=752140 RepID=UPI00047518C0|nr:L-rhamnose mutarotase [Pedobacter arcticus]
MKKYCLALDLKEDSTLIKEYVEWHENVWPEIVESITNSGIIAMSIYRFNNRLFMIMETEDSFSFEKKAIMDAGNDKVQEWEEIMWKYQQQIPGAKVGEKWVLMESIFSLGGPVK